MRSKSFSHRDSGGHVRKNMSVWRSQDSGHTFKPSDIFRVDPGFSGYSCLSRLPPIVGDDVVGLLYERGDVDGCEDVACRIDFTLVPLIKTDDPSSYDYSVSFDSPSKRGARDSMPTGNGFQAGNVWAEVDADSNRGSAAFYVARGEAYDSASLPFSLLLASEHRVEP